MPHSLIDGTDPAQAQVAPRMELARALIQSGADTSPAYPMQAIARAIQPLAGHMIQRDATSELARLYASQAGGMAEALRKYAPDHPLVAALQSSDPGVQAMALRQAGPAMIELPKEAESKRRFGIESGMTREGLDLRRELADRPEFKPDLGIDPRTGYKQSGWANPKTQTITPYQPGGGAPGAAMAAPIVMSSPNELLNFKGSGKPAPFGTRYIRGDDPEQKVRIWEGG